ncbi:MAG: acetyl-CoA carboxylase biotin carboxyl carrier protein [Candidatus Omnitrophota bacterium]
MNIKKIKELVELMNDNEIVEVEVEQEGMKVRLLKQSQAGAGQIVMPAAIEKATVSTVSETAETKKEENKNLKEVKSPMVGTFYSSPAPDADPYVAAGDTVKKGDVLCIVEAMKLMNEIKAEFGGKIVEVCAKNADPVEFSQPLFIIDPA